MVSIESDVHRLSLIVLRLMDSDLLLPVEGGALISEIEAFEQARDEASAECTPASRNRLHSALEALVQTHRLDALTPGEAQEMVYQIIRGTGDEAGANSILPPMEIDQK